MLLSSNAPAVSSPSTSASPSSLGDFPPEVFIKIAQNMNTAGFQSLRATCRGARTALENYEPIVKTKAELVLLAAEETNHSDRYLLVTVLPKDGKKAFERYYHPEKQTKWMKQIVRLLDLYDVTSLSLNGLFQSTLIFLSSISDRLPYELHWQEVEWNHKMPVDFCRVEFIHLLRAMKPYKLRISCDNRERKPPAPFADLLNNDAIEELRELIIQQKMGACSEIGFDSWQNIDNRFIERAQKLERLVIHCKTTISIFPIGRMMEQWALGKRLIKEIHILLQTTDIDVLGMLMALKTYDVTFLHREIVGGITGFLYSRNGQHLKLQAAQTNDVSVINLHIKNLHFAGEECRCDVYSLRLSKSHPLDNRGNRL